MTTLLKNRAGRFSRLLALAGAGAVLCIVAYYVVFSANGLMVYREKRRASQELERQIKTLQQQNGAIQNEIKALRTDPQTIEKEARERLHYTRPGEVVYSLPSATAVTSPRK